ncbi:MAG TPA: sulfatase-like hydrolase/transferase [Polyangiaceae bacterium]|nr:sulfatase-like hydrolase/transferase [Polyangiaceae bacterium]
MMRSGLAPRALVVLAVVTASCRKAAPPPPPPAPFPVASIAAESVGPSGDAEPPAREHASLIDRAPSCEIEHHGRLLDLGIEASSPWTNFRLMTPSPDDVVTRDGTTYLEVSSRNLSYEVWLNRPMEHLRVTLRGRAGSARRVQVSVDGKRLGVVRLPEGEPKIFDLPELTSDIEAGLHRIDVAFGGAPRGAHAPLAELDWLRISGSEDRRGDEGYAAPTLSDIVQNVALGNVPRRAFALRAPTTVRCFVRPVAGTSLRVALGFWGTGRGAAEIVATREGAPPATLETHRIAGGESSSWTQLDVDLSRFAGDPIALELRAIDTSRGGRIAFGDPELVQHGTPPAGVGRARVAVLVVLSSVEQAELPPWGPTGALGTLGSIARDGAAFSRYRAPSTASASVLATLLTGLSPRAHSVEAPMLKLPPTLRTLARLVKEANGTAAFFSGVPTSFAPFGFDASWDAFETFSPVKDIAATEPFSRAAAWLTHELEERPLARHFVVVHGRGTHPPWDVSREDAQRLKPPEYNGAIEPRRAGIILGALRARAGRGGKKLTDDDWTRLNELGQAALAKQDVGVGEIVRALKKAGIWDSTLFVVMGDVAAGGGVDLPFDPAGPLTEDRLAAPLLVKFPGGALRGQEVAEPVTAEDVAATLERALDLGAPEFPATIDLVERALTGVAVERTAQYATLPGRYATRIGPWLLRGELGARPRLCAFDVDPACAVDAFEERSIAARAAWLATLLGEDARVPKELGSAQRTAVELDPETRAALTVWGDIPP